MAALVTNDNSFVVNNNRKKTTEKDTEGSSKFYLRTL